MPSAELEYPMPRDSVASKSRHRFQALDGLRGVAALFVVLLHVEWTNHLTENRLIQHSYVAVDLFFILSGFVISANYSHRIDNVREALTFLGLRFFRLYPLHLAMLVAFVCLEWAKLAAQHSLAIMPGAQAPFTEGESFGSAIANLLLINGLHVLDKPGWNDPSWSISCEFAAYIVFAITTLAGLARSRLFFIWGTLVVVAAYVGLALSRGTLNVTLDWGIIRCLAGFFFGMLIFRFREMNCIRQSRMLIGGCSIVVIIAVLLTMALTSGSLIVLVIPLFVIAIALLQSDQGPLARLLISPGVQLLGRISYSIYMVHSFFVVCILIILKRVFVLPSVFYSMRENPIVSINPWIGDLLVLGLVVGVVATASATYALIEEPGRLFGRRLLANQGNRSSTLVSG
jgi:peptidoglycan/LPS O-acetylase OafA/YrhL